MVLKHKGSPSGPLALERRVIALADTLCATITTTEVVLVVTGVKAGDVVAAVPATALTDGLNMMVALVAADAVTVRFVNPTIAGVQTGAIDLNLSIMSYS